MSSGGQDSYAFIPRWNEEAATLESFDQRVKLFVSSTKKEERYLCAPRLLATFDPEGDTFRNVRDKLTDVQLEAAEGSSALMIVKNNTSLCWSRVNSGRCSWDFFRLDSLRRNYGETMRHWTRRFTLHYSKVGRALNASNAEINKDLLHENIRGILLAETSGLTSSVFASVLATSGTTSAEGESIGNNWKFSHLVEAFCTQWGDAALAARDAKARKSEAVVAAVDNFGLSELSEAAARIENAISWNDTDPKIVELKMMTMTTTKKTLTGTLVTVMMSWITLHTQLVLRQMTQNFLNSLMAIWKMLMRPYLKCMLQQVAVFKKHVSFWLVSRVPEAIFLLLELVLLMAWLSHPLIEKL